MTTLVIDIGNSRIKWAIADRGHLLAPGEACPHSAIDALHGHWARLPPPTAVRYVTTAPGPISARVTELSQTLWGITPRRVRTPKEGAGIRIAYPDPGQLGTDRWLAMAGAAARGLLPACIVDCGSAITVDAVNPHGHHLGGVILAGLATQQLGLAQRTPGLPPIDVEGELTHLATDTRTGLRSGLVLGTAASVEGLYNRLQAATELDLRLVLTGGDAETLRPHLPASLHAPDLVLEGLAHGAVST
ncbi:type III pantothenate kinase [Spiribacter halobius]|uniref:Type III pantothenate kinase n=1 Tax=Sediminicurvatus halobius TaxID=2182432 RepID=A0A2U2N0S5_9GAMM|nr:type III pantothenate kinase [Spiribacter halobius]PWG62720.1 hypothetical protein DEM34_11270 [Spiribacter halobius]UEX77388.1 type III pantothenate kinase [Spiribacter halobius]